MKKIWYKATGKKKRSIAKIAIKTNKINIIKINEKSIKEYFPKRYPYKNIILPLILINKKNKFKIIVKVKGGGVVGQIMAIRHGIALAIINYNKKFKKLFRKNKLVTRDSRVVERKKLGKHKARKNKQFSKR